MSRIVLGCLALGSLLFVQNHSRAAEVRAKQPELIVYAYDSFVSKHGLGPAITPLFEKSCDCRLKLLGSGDGGQLLTRLQLDAERKKSGAHVVVGLDQQLWERAREYTESWSGWKPAGYDQVVSEARVGEGFMPFDYGVFAFIADGQQLKAAQLKAPAKLADLLKPEWKRKIILQDPRTSTPGLAFTLYTHAVVKDPAAFLKEFRSQWLTLTPGWDEAYGLFLKSEAPLVWSYTTSQAYHEENGDKSARYQAVLFDEGQPVQIEGAAIIKGAVNDVSDLKRAQAFLELLVSAEVQTLVAKKNWMFPVRKGVELPSSFQKLPKPKKIVKTETSASGVSTILKGWSQVVEGAR